MSAKRLETFDVVADVASARARRFRGGSEARARRSRYVSRVLAGTRARARVRGLLRTHVLRPQRRLRAPSMRSTPSAPSPEARGGRWTLWGAGDAKQPRKRREKRRARAAACELVMLMSSAYRPSLLVTRVKWMLWYLAGGRRTLARHATREPRHLPRPLCSHIVPPKSRPWLRVTTVGRCTLLKGGGQRSRQAGSELGPPGSRGGGGRAEVPPPAGP